MPQLQPGLSATVSQLVSNEMTANTVGSGSVAVFATPELVRLIEQAAVAALDGALEAGQTSVGVQLNISHLAPTPVGMHVFATATLTQIDGRRLMFAISARDEAGLISEGTHSRYVVDAARFLQKAKAKK